MKKIAIRSLLVMLFVSSLPLAAQTVRVKGYAEPAEYELDYPKSEIYIQYGAPSIVEITSKLTNDDFDRNYASKYKGSNYKYTGVGAIGYNYYIGPYFSFGAYLGISKAQMSVREIKTDRIVYHNHVTSYTGMLAAHWTFYREGIWELSAGLSMGVCRKDEDQSHLSATSEGGAPQMLPHEKDQWTFAYNLTACKARIGGTIGGFLELGFGYKGLVNAGLSVKF